MHNPTQIAELADAVANRVGALLAGRLERERPALLSVDGVARLLSVSVRTVWKLTSTGELPSPIKLPGTRVVRWRRSEVLEWVEGLK